MILRTGNRKVVHFPNRKGPAEPTNELCRHGFPHGVTKVAQRFTKADGSVGWAMKEVPEKDSCTH